MTDSQTRLEQIFNQAPLAIAMLEGSQHIFTFANPSFINLFCLDRAIIGRPTFEVFPGSVAGGFIQIMDQVFQTGQPFVGEDSLLEQITRSGESRTLYLDIVYEPVRNLEGQVHGILASAWDVTAQVKARHEVEDANSRLQVALEKIKIQNEELELAKLAAETANDAKSAFLANMSHEIRTPLGVIMGFADLLRDPKMNEAERANSIEIINRNGRSLSRVIDDILDLSKVESGRLEIELVATPIAEIIHDIETLFSDQVRLKGIVLRTHIHPGVPSVIHTDPTRLRQILVNVVGNAVKFTEKGSVDIEVHAKHLEEGSRKNRFQIEFAIRDTGPGIETDQIKYLFKPFVQADISTTRKFGGTGLGLALSKRLALALGGDVLIRDCKLNHGCTFAITLLADANTSDLSPRPLPSAQNYESSGILNQRQILLIEDSVDNQALISRVLTKAGALVTLASQGIEGLEKTTLQEFDLVLMDIQMPIMDGYQAMKELVIRGYKIPVIALTAHAMDEERKKTEKAGFAAHVTKPIETQELIQTIASLLSRR